MKRFYLKLQEKLFSAEATALFTAANIKPVKSIDFYKQQYLSQESFDLLVLPSVLMDFDIIYDDDKKPAATTISLHCCYETFRQTGGTKITPVKALEFFDYVDIIYKLVHNLESECTGKIKLSSENQDKNDAIINVHLLTFTGSYSGRVTNTADNYNYSEADGDLEETSSLVEKLIEATEEAKPYDLD